MPWPARVQWLAHQAKAVGAGILVIDTLRFWATLGPKDENDAGAVQAAMSPLLTAAGATGLAVVVTHHARKAKGVGGTSAAGSLAFVGAVDTVLEVKIYSGVDDDDPRRKILARGRFVDPENKFGAEQVIRYEKPRAANANYCTSGELSPLFNDPYYGTIGIGTRIYLGGGVGYVCFPGTQHHPTRPRDDRGIPLRPAGTLMVIGDLKQMSPRHLVGVSLLGYGCSLTVGLGVPIPVLNEEIARFCGVSDEELFAPIVDYGADYPQATGRVLGQVSYAQLKTGKIELKGKEIPTGSLSSYPKAVEIAHTLKH